MCIMNREEKLAVFYVQQTSHVENCGSIFLHAQTDKCFLVFETDPTDKHT